MIDLPVNSITRLPLSWTRTDIDVPEFKKINLPYSAPHWIPTAEIPAGHSFEQVYETYLKNIPNGFVLQSCNLAIRNFLLEQGYQAAAMGAEALLDLPWRGKRSTRELARRGRRHGVVREIELNPMNQIKLNRLLRNSAARQSVQLQFTERTELDASTRCFVFEAPDESWLGAVTTSSPAQNTIHIEKMLRHKRAPVGIMEALITATAEQLAEEGIAHLSLGAVTPLPVSKLKELFKAHRHPNELWELSKLSFQLGSALKFAFNGDGLWQFKNKFSPRWEPLYLVASPNLSLSTMLGLLQATGYLNLVWTQSVNILLAPISTRLDNALRKIRIATAPFREQLRLAAFANARSCPFRQKYAQE
jgi:hypothetical protein